MDPTVAATAAPEPAAPSSTPTTLTATEHAATTGNFRDFRTAKQAERTGKPLPEVTVDAKGATVEAAKPAAAPPIENRKTRAERDQDRINDSIRTASEAAAAPLKAEIDRLKAELQAKPAAETSRPPAAAAAAAEPPAKNTPEYKRIMALEGAPKLADFDSVEEHAFAAAEFIDSTRTREREATARDRASRDARTASERAADTAFFGQIEDAKKADPEFTSKLAPEVKALTPLEWMPRDAHGRYVDAQGRPTQAGPLNIVASEMRKSPMVADLMRHFSQHPADLQQFAVLPPSIAAIADPGQRVQAHVQHIVREFNRLEGRLASAGAAPRAAVPPKTVSDAPSVETLGERAAEAAADPVMSAAKKGDFKQFRAAKRARLAAGVS